MRFWGHGEQGSVIGEHNEAVSPRQPCVCWEGGWGESIGGRGLGARKRLRGCGGTTSFRWGGAVGGHYRS